ncbi:hypothetical protein HYT01_02410 [Candidatus Giovannonibacteria bacterium]|nr:hypothetical protein [Candidatus Giovannonibacteria bacterium]
MKKLNLSIKKLGFSLILGLLPLLAAAQGGGTDVNSTLLSIQQILRNTIIVLFVLATVVFLWGVIKYMTAGGDEDAISSGRNFMIFGIIGLFVMVAVWGLVYLLVNTFALPNSGGIPTQPL